MMTGKLSTACGPGPKTHLARHADGDWEMIYPTLTTLKSICGHDDTSALLAAVDRGEHLPDWSGELGGQGMQSLR